MNAQQELIYQRGYRDGLHNTRDEDLMCNQFYYAGYVDGCSARLHPNTRGLKP